MSLPEVAAKKLISSRTIALPNWMLSERVELRSEVPKFKVLAWIAIASVLSKVKSSMLLRSARKVLVSVTKACSKLTVSARKLATTSLAAPPDTWILPASAALSALAEEKLKSFKVTAVLKSTVPPEVTFKVPALSPTST